MTNSSTSPDPTDKRFQQWLAILPSHLQERTRTVALSKNSIEQNSGAVSAPIVYWTHHAQRVDENPALDVACALACALDRPLLVYHGLSSDYRYSSDRHHVFQIQSAKDLQQAYSELGIRYVFHLQTKPDNTPSLLRLAQQTDLLITEDFPGEPTDRWLKRLTYLKHLSILAVDTACVVPMRLVGKAHDRAFAFRDATKKLYQERISRAWPKLAAIPEPYKGNLPFETHDCLTLDPYSIVSQCDIDPMVPPVCDTIGGSRSGYQRWSDFLKLRIHRYGAKRNDPCADVSSRMSAYLHYGMVSPMRLARQASECRAEKYLDELLIWRELAYGYCFYREDYRSLATIPNWAVETLRKHQSDRREALYSWETLARGQTADPLWNACQHSLLKHGELHNNVRMTWGKSLLQWTESPEQALAWLIDLNHRFALDGRDPASYGGILWCLGQFDRPFSPEQPVLGTVRPRPTSEHLGRLDFGKYQALVNRPIVKLKSAERPVKVGVIGAGISGLLCARTLADMGLDVEVFEKSRGAGGRAATRRLDSGNWIDHGAPCFQTSSKRWDLYLESWQRDGILSRWEPRLATWSPSKGTEQVTLCDNRTTRLWRGNGGMNQLGKHLAKGLKIRYQTTIEQVEKHQTGWVLSGKTGSQETSVSILRSDPFDCVVLAVPGPQAALMIDPGCHWKSKAAECTMRPAWAAIVEFDKSWEIPWDAICFEDHPILDWISRETSRANQTPSNNGSGLPEAWIIHANDRWTAANIDNSPQDAAQRLMQALVDLGFEDIPGLITLQGHRWRYAQAGPRPEGSSNEPSVLWDPELLAGACGDWACGDWACGTATFGRLGRSSGVERALESGSAMAGTILRHCMSKQSLANPMDREKQAFQPMLFGDEAF
jgi:photolyase PhrII